MVIKGICSALKIPGKIVRFDLSGSVLAKIILKIAGYSITLIPN